MDVSELYPAINTSLSVVLKSSLQPLSFLSLRLLEMVSHGAFGLMRGADTFRYILYKKRVHVYTQQTKILA